MASGTAVAERPSAAPALAYSGATEITSEDVALPRVKKGEKMSKHEVPFGCIFTELGSDDPDPQVIAAAGNPTSKPVRIYVVAGPVKGWSYSEPGGDLEMWRWDDPNRHPDAWKTYKYLVALPEVDEDIPYSILFTKTSAPAAKQLNTILQKAAAFGPTHEVPLDLTAKKTENQRGTFCVFQVRRADVPAAKLKKQLKVVNDLYGMASGLSPGQVAASGDAPADTVTDAPAI